MSALQLFAMRLKQARLQNGLTQMQLGVMAQIDEGSASARINQYERGKYWPDFGTAERLTKTLNMPAAFFYARDDLLADLILCDGRLNATDYEKLLAQAKDFCRSAKEAADSAEASCCAAD
jgi:transcriptional regulator with XRE-family HTH domain